MDTRVRSRIEPVGGHRSAGALYLLDHPPSPARRHLHAEGCWLMGIARSTYYDKPAASIDDTALVETIVTISDSFEA